MSNKINTEIIDFIDGIDNSIEIKDFLKKILVLELDLMEDAKRRNKKQYDYKDKYKKIIDDIEF